MNEKNRRHLEFERLESRCTPAGLFDGDFIPPDEPVEIVDESGVTEEVNYGGDGVCCDCDCCAGTEEILDEDWTWTDDGTFEVLPVEITDETGEPDGGAEDFTAIDDGVPDEGIIGGESDFTAIDDGVPDAGTIGDESAPPSDESGEIDLEWLENWEEVPIDDSEYVYEYDPSWEEYVDPEWVDGCCCDCGCGTGEYLYLTFADGGDFDYRDFTADGAGTGDDGEYAIYSMMMLGDAESIPDSTESGEDGFIDTEPTGEGGPGAEPPVSTDDAPVDDSQVIYMLSASSTGTNGNNNHHHHNRAAQRREAAQRRHALLLQRRAERRERLAELNAPKRQRHAAQDFLEDLRGQLQATLSRFGVHHLLF